ncbi:MAG: hypothetical protein Q8T09_14800 [Candidatus Melainabacteria bacterium]|nr:hypothetical protein [Candidatus Melainabacteria bacterium]
MKQAESDFREVRNNSQVSEQAAAQIGAVGRMADELFASGMLKDSKFGSQSKCPSASEVKKCFHPDNGKGKDLEGGVKDDGDEDFDGDDEDFDSDEDLNDHDEDDSDEDLDGDVKGGKGKPQPNYCKDGSKLDDNQKDLHGTVGGDNEKGELKKNFYDQDLQGAVGDGGERGELKQNFNGNDRSGNSDRENRDYNSGNRNWPRSFRDNDESLPPSLFMDNPYQTFTA